MKNPLKKAVNSQNKAARKTILEELFQDFYRDRLAVYRMNFIRGIAFGLGSVLGGTILVAIAVWIMSQFVDWPGIGDYFESLRDTLQTRPR